MIAVFKINGLGDNIVFVPAVQALRSRFPKVHVVLVTTPEAAELYGGALGPQKVFTAKKARFNKAHKRPWELAAWWLRFRLLSPQACFMSYDQGSVAQLLCKSIGADVRVGADQHNTKVPASLTCDVSMPADGCVATWNWDMARALARDLGDTTEWPVRPPVPDFSHLLKAGPRPRGPRARVLIHPGAGKKHTQWSEDLFALVASALSSDYEVVWISHGSSATPTPAGCVQAQVASLSELASWISSADLFLGNNSGPMHLADALGCRGVAVTGPSSRGWDPYWNPAGWSVLRHPNLACAPCEDLSRELVSCANLESPMACMRYWTPALVEKACRERLERAVPAKP